MARSESSDDALIERVLDGEPQAIDTLREWVRRAAAKYRIQLGEDLEDLEQEILFSLTRDLAAGTFDGRSTLRTYVVSRTYYRCIDRLRSRRRREWVDIDDLDLPSSVPSPLQRLDAKQSVELAGRVLEELPETCRELWGHLQDGLGYREMSRLTGVSEVTLRSRVLRCRRRAQELRAELQRAPSEAAGKKNRQSLQRNPSADD